MARRRFLIAHPTAEKAIQLVADSILAGGYAVDMWTDHFRLARVGTKDIDFVGPVDEAKTIARALNAELRLPRQEGPLAAYFFVAEGEYARFAPHIIGDYYRVDYMRKVCGVNMEKLKDNALSMEYKGKVLRIMHPLDCLRSRIANLAVLENKQNEHSETQAKAAIKIVHAYIRSLHADRDGRELSDTVTGARLIAHSKHALKVHALRGIDTLAAIPARHLPDKFQQMWPRIQEEVNAARAKYRALPPLEQEPDEGIDIDDPRNSVAGDIPRTGVAAKSP